MTPDYDPAAIPPAQLLEIIQIQSAVVQQGLNFSNVMFLIAERARLITGSDGAVVEIEEDNQLVYRATAGIADRQLGLRLAAQSSLSGLCIQTRTPLSCVDSEQDERVNRLACQKVGLRSMIVFPLIHLDKVVGVLKVFSKEPDHYTPVSLAILDILSQLFSAAMHTASTYSQDELYRKATTDWMTGIRNRSMFFDLLRSRIAKAPRVQDRFGVVMLDMDNLKKLNDTYGHKVGDAALLAIVGRVQGVLREADALCRLGGDEFGILVEQIGAPESLTHLLDRIAQHTNGFFHYEGTSYALSISTGCAVFPDDSNEMNQLLDIADQRMYAEKREKKSCRV